jgi:hypothetical protein
MHLLRIIFQHRLDSCQDIIPNANCQNLVGESNFLQKSNFMHRCIRSAKSAIRVCRSWMIRQLFRDTGSLLK